MDARVSSEPSCGAIYVAYGKDYFREAENSAASLKEHNQLSCICFCDGDYGPSEVFDSIVLYERTEVNRNYKIKAILNSPFERTVYIDTDTFVCGDLSSALKLLDRFDFALVHSPIAYGKSPSSSTELTASIPEAFIEFNGGVLFYRKSRASMAVFNNWLELYNKTSRKLDQPTLRESIYFSEARFYVLPPEFNLTFTGPVFLEGSARILHGRFGRKNLVMSPMEYKAIATRINSYMGRRVYIPGLGLLSMRQSLFRLKPRNLVKGLLRRLNLLFVK